MIFVIGVGLTGTFYIHKMADTSRAIYQDGLVPVKTLAKLRFNLRTIDSYMLELMITTDPKLIETNVASAEAKFTESDALIYAYKKSPLDSFQRSKLNELESKYRDFRAASLSTFDLAKQKKHDQAYQQYLKYVKTQRSEISKLAQELSDYVDKQADELNNSTSLALPKATSFMSIVILVAILLSSFIGFLIQRSIVRPVKEIQSLMSRTEQGDFTVEGTYLSKDEMGQLTQSFNRMIREVREVIRQVASSSEMVSASAEQLTASAEETSKASQQIAVTIQEVAAGAGTQAEKAEDTAATMEKMSTNVQQMTANTEHVSEAAFDTANKVRSGNAAILSTEQQMLSIQENVNRLSGVIQGLGDRSSEIEKITDLITNIAKQTNLLALNAAIEAARAGEHGRGFAVVADEVRKLAEESSHSAIQISRLISTIQTETAAAVQSMEQTIDEVASGLVLVSTAGDAFEQIETSVGIVTAEINQVVSAIQELTAGTDQIARAISQVAEVAEQNASGTQNISAATEEQLASMEEISASAQSLSRTAHDLQQLISKFNI